MLKFYVFQPGLLFDGSVREVICINQYVKGPATVTVRLFRISTFYSLILFLALGGSLKNSVSSKVLGRRWC